MGKSSRTGKIIDGGKTRGELQSGEGVGRARSHLLGQGDGGRDARAAKGRQGAGQLGG